MQSGTAKKYSPMDVYIEELKQDNYFEFFPFNYEGLDATSNVYSFPQITLSGYPTTPNNDLLYNPPDVALHMPYGWEQNGNKSPESDPSGHSVLDGDPMAIADCTPYKIEELPKYMRSPSPESVDSPSSSPPTTPGTGPEPIAIDSFNIVQKSRVQRRREQNRAAQRAFRVRREDRMKELEQELGRMQREASQREQSDTTKLQELSLETVRLQKVVMDKDHCIASLVQERSSAATGFARANIFAVNADDHSGSLSPNARSRQHGKSQRRR